MAFDPSCWLPSSIGSFINIKILGIHDCRGLKGLNVWKYSEVAGSSLKVHDLKLLYNNEAPISISTWSCLYRLDKPQGLPQNASLWSWRSLRSDYNAHYGLPEKGFLGCKNVVSFLVEIFQRSRFCRYLAWRKALEEVAGIAGYHSSNSGNEADLINKVASDVTAVLGFTPSKDFDDFVGTEYQVTEIKSKLILQSEEIKVIALVGPAGIGKTTTARVLYNQLSPCFPFNTFLENIRGSYEKPCGNDYQLKKTCRHLGVAQQMLSGKKVLVVLDEVDSRWQLEEMANQRGWVGPGSIVIITTEDKKLLKSLGLGTNHMYEMIFPASTWALQIFCQYAFGQNSPDYGFTRNVHGRVDRGTTKAQPLPCLKLIDLSKSEYLKENPDLSEAELDLCGCKSLLELTVSKLNDCVLVMEFSGCSSLKELIKLRYTAIEEMPSSISTWSCLNLKEFPNVSDSINELELCNTGIEEVPPWIENLLGLRKLLMYGCGKLKTISPNISKLKNLYFLGLKIHTDDGLFEARIEWSRDLMRSWTLRSDFYVDYIFPICLPEEGRLLHLQYHYVSSALDVSGCRDLVALPQLPGSLLSLDAEDCVFLKIIDSSFHNPKICLNFPYCFNLDQKARKLIQTSACKHAVLPGQEVPAHFTHRATSDLFLHPLDSKGNINPKDSVSVDVNFSSVAVTCRVRGKQNGLTVGRGSTQLQMLALYGRREHLIDLKPKKPLSASLVLCSESMINPGRSKAAARNKTEEEEESGRDENAEARTRKRM
ncbi:LOW QUALITY PROTEIN: hypothetical protein HID58_045510, partial [Brassica napus]